jgi:hypothetical protein
MRTRIIGALVATAALTLPLAAQFPAATAGEGGGRNPVAGARDATRPFHSLMFAKHSGYSTRVTDKNGITCIAMPGQGAMGIHFAKPSLIGDPRIRIGHPEVLVYARENGRRHLVALEYLVLKKDWERVHGQNAHRPWLYKHRFNFTHAGNRFGLPPYYSLHAWIWKKNPAGMFEMWNPNVHCPM